MLNNISNQDNLNINEKVELLKLGLSSYKGKALSENVIQLVDESNISEDALKLYEKESDIKKFTQLTLSDPENNSHNRLVFENLLSNGVSLSDSADIIEALLNNDEFLSDIIG